MKRSNRDTIYNLESVIECIEAKWEVRSKEKRTHDGSELAELAVIINTNSHHSIMVAINGVHTKREAIIDAVFLHKLVNPARVSKDTGFLEGHAHVTSDSLGFEGQIPRKGSLYRWK
jgi:hypothetical protein